MLKENKSRGRKPRPVVNRTTGEVYPSVGAAAAAIGVSSGIITQIAQGKMAPIRGNRLAYQDGGGAERSQLHVAHGRKTATVKLPPIIFSTLIYDRLAKAAVEVGSPISKLVTAAVVYTLDAHDRGEMTWPILSRNVGKPTRPVIELDSQMIFESVNAAAEYFNISGSSVSIIAGGYRKKARPGRRFAYLDDHIQTGETLPATMPEAPAATSANPSNHPTPTTDPEQSAI